MKFLLRLGSLCCVHARIQFIYRPVSHNMGRSALFATQSIEREHWRRGGDEIQIELFFCGGALDVHRCRLGRRPAAVQRRLSLDWDGIRSEWLDKGVDVRIGYVSETATNVQGGDRELVRYTDQFTFSATFDLEKLLGFKQATFKLAITDRNGDNLSSDANLQSLQQVQELYGRDQTWRWTQFWYQQKYLDGLVTWKIGRITEGEDFAAFSCEFMNLTFCGAQPGNIVGSYWYNWPVSQWATDVKISLKGVGYFRSAPSMSIRTICKTSTPWISGGRAARAGSWYRWSSAGSRPFGDGLKGTYKLGAWYNSSTAPDVVENLYGPAAVGQWRSAPHAPRPIRGVREFPAAAHRALGRSGRSAHSSTQPMPTGARPRRTIRSRRGFFIKGLFDSRPADEVGFAIGRTHVNSRIADARDADRCGESRVGGRARVRVCRGALLWLPPDEVARSAPQHSVRRPAGRYRSKHQRCHRRLESVGRPLNEAAIETARALTTRRARGRAPDRAAPSSAISGYTIK